MHYKVFLFKAGPTTLNCRSLYDINIQLNISQTIILLTKSYSTRNVMKLYLNGF